MGANYVEFAKGWSSIYPAYSIIRNWKFVVSGLRIFKKAFKTFSCVNVSTA